MQTIDIFAHVLPPRFYTEMLAMEPSLPQRFPFILHPHLQDLSTRRQFWDQKTQQVISNANINPEDYVAGEEAARLCRAGNAELAELVQENAVMFYAAVGMVPFNQVDEALKILEEIAAHPKLVGVQFFTRALGKSLADPAFEALFARCQRLNLPIWLHPIFDERKPDNNIIFSWEYELTLTMLELVQAGYFKKYPDLKIIVHHAGAMVPYFAERINHILPEDQAKAFKNFYVDTALLGNPQALQLAIAYYGIDHVLFGTDAPLGIAPAGATRAILEALKDLSLPEEDLAAICHGNAKKLL